MEISDVKYSQYLQILREELLPAMGCTEPIAMAYAAAKARQTLGAMPDKIDIVISGNIIKNVKSVVVPNTGGLKGIAAAVAAGTVVGDADKQLEVLSFVKPEEIPQIGKFMDECQMTVMKSESGKLLDIDLHMYKGTDSVRLRICDYHTNIVLIEKNGQVLLKKDESAAAGSETDRSVLNVHDILDFAESVCIDDVRDMLERQIEYNLAISEEGLRGNYGASIGKTLLETRGDDVRVRARAQAAAGSDARMSGCELPVVIVSGSGKPGHDRFPAGHRVCARYARKPRAASARALRFKPHNHPPENAHRQAQCLLRRGFGRLRSRGRRSLAFRGHIRGRFRNDNKYARHDIRHGLRRCKALVRNENCLCRRGRASGL